MSKSITTTAVNLFTAEDEKLAELKKSSEIIDMLTAVLMEPHSGTPLTEDNDAFGLWYNFARPKAKEIVKRFNVTQKLTDVTKDSDQRNTSSTHS